MFHSRGCFPQPLRTRADSARKATPPPWHYSITTADHTEADNSEDGALS